MAGAIGVRSFADTHSCPCLCLDSMYSSSLSGKINVEFGLLQRNLSGNRPLKKIKSVDLSSSFLDAWYECRLSAKVLSYAALGCSRKKQKLSKRTVVDELGGQYEEGFEDVKKEIINYITYKAVRTVMEQLYEMNKPQYMWFHNFVASTVPDTGKRFLQTLAKENQQLAERVMITRLHLYGKWIKACDHAQIYKEISDENVELMRERLIETVIWPSDDANTENLDEV